MVILRSDRRNSYHLLLLSSSINYKSSAAPGRTIIAYPGIQQYLSLAVILFGHSNQFQMDYLQKIIGAFEIHSAEGIKVCFENGVDPNQLYKVAPVIYEFINMYLRGPEFKSCIKVFVDFGLKFDDKVLLAVLLDDTTSLDRLLTVNKELVFKNIH